MPTTARGYPYPVLDVTPNVPLDLQALAEALDVDVAALAAAVVAAAEALAQATAAATANTLAKRDANGRLKVADPSAATDAATKAYVDTDSAVAKTVATRTASATANALVQRDAAGRTKVADPSAATDAATKGYVDRFKPWSTEVTSTPTLAPNATNDVVVTFPTGRYSATPGLSLLPASLAIECRVVTRSATSCTIRFQNVSGGSTGVTTALLTAFSND